MKLMGELCVSAVQSRVKLTHVQVEEELAAHVHKWVQKDRTTSMLTDDVWEDVTLWAAADE